MRMIPLIRQAFGRHGPRRWFSGLFTILLCLFNLFSLTGLGFVLPTSHAAPYRGRFSPQNQSAALHTPEHQSASQLTHSAPQHRSIIHVLKGQIVSHKTQVGPQHRLQTHIRQIGTGSDLGTTATSSASLKSRSTKVTSPHVVSTSNPDVSISANVHGGPTFQVGQTLTFDWNITNISATILDATSNVQITNLIPSGLTSITTTGSNWTITTSAPSLVATYSGPPVAPGATFAPLEVSGTLTANAVPTFSTTASVSDNSSGTNSATFTVNVAPPPPPDFALAMSHSNSACVLVGSSATFTLTATNGASAGSEATGPITITDTLPAALSTVTATSAGWTTSVSGTTLTATYSGTLPIAASASLPVLSISGTVSNTAGATLANTATLSAPGDTNAANNTANNSIVVCQPDLSISMSHTGSGPFQVGQPFTFTVAVSNVSTTPVQSNIVVTDQLPVGLSNVVIGGSSWTTSISGSTLTATYNGSFPVAGNTTLQNISISGQLTNSAVGSFSNTATVSTPNDTGSENNSATDTVTVVALPDLTTTLTHTGTGCNPTGNINDTLVVNNTGTGVGPVLNGPITATLTLPNSLSNVSVTPGSNWSVTNVGPVYTLTYTGTYPVAAGASLPPVTVTGNAAVSSLTLNATATTSTDSNTGNNASSDAITICAPDLVITNTHSGSGPFQVGQNVTYTLSVSNAPGSGSVQTNEPITITDQVPAGLSQPTITGTDWTLTLNNGTLTGTYTGTLPVLASTTLSPITISGLLASNASPTLSSTATVSTPRDTNLSNNTSTDTMTVQPLPDLAVTLTHVGTACVTHGAIAYTLTVTNGSTAGSVLNASVRTALRANITGSPVGSPITVTATLPADLTSIAPTAPSGWSFTLNGHTVTATYTGSYPVATGASLPSITLAGTLTTPTTSTLTANATVTLANDSNLANNSATDSISICGPDMAITKTTQGSGPFQVGNSVSFILSTSNSDSAGPVFTANPVTVTDQIPVGLTNVTAAGTGWTTTTGNGALTITYTGTYPVNPGTTLPDILVSGQLTGAALSTFSNTATVNVVGDTNSDNNSATASFPVVGQPDLALALIHTNTGCNSTQEVSYSLDLSNLSSAGPLLSGPVSVQITPPTNLTNVSVVATTPADWSLVQNGDQSWTATYSGSYPIAAADSLSGLTITGTATSSPVTLNATATVSNDASTTNNTATDTIIVCAPNPTITEAIVGSGPYQIGQNISFTISVNNPSDSGPILSGPLTITDQVPNGLANPVLTGSGWTSVSPSISTSSAPTTVSATYNGPFPIPAGTTLPTLTLTGQLTNAAGTTLTNPVSVGAPGVSSSSNTTATQTVPIVLGPDLSLVITPQTTCGNLNDQLSYTLAVSNSANAGPVPANTPVTLTLNLPPDLSAVSTSAVSDWQGLGSASGTTATLTYTSSNPVLPGDNLPVITLTGLFSNPNITGVILTGAVSTSGDSGTSNEAGSGMIAICRPDLAIAKTHLESGPFQIGSAVNFLLAVTNVGYGSVQPNEPIVVTDHIPSGFSSVQASGLDWYVTVLNNTVVAVYTGSYPVDPAISLPNIIVSGQLTSDSPPTLTNTATVTTPRDKNLNNNTSTERITVQAAPDLRLHIAGPNSCVSKDRKATFTFQVTNDANAGPISASQPITLTFRLPDGLDQVDFSGSDWSWHKNGSDITATYLNALAIAPGQDLGSFSLTGKVTKSVGGVVGFSAVVHMDNDSHTSNNTSYGKLSVCKHSQSGSGGSSHSGGSGGSGGSSGGGSGGSGGGGGGGTGGGGTYPGLPPTGSDPLAA